MTLVHRSRFVDYTPANITALAFSHRSCDEKLTPSDLRLAVGRADGSIEVWNPRHDWFQEQLLEGGADRTVEGLCWCNIPGEPLRLFSIGGSTVVTEWDLTTGLPLKNYDCNAGVIWSIAINEAGDKLAVGCDNGTVVTINIAGGAGILEHDTILMRQEARVLSLAWNRNDYIIGGCSDGRIRIWSVKSSDENRGRITHTMRVDKSGRESTLVWSVLYLPGKNTIVSGDSTGSVKFWNFHYATLTQSFKSHEADVLCLAADVNESNIFSAGVDRKIFQYSTDKSNKWINASNRLLHGNDIRALCAYQSKGADFLVSGGVDKTLFINPISSFADGRYRKMPFVVPYNKNVLINRSQRLVVCWEGATVKIWTLGDDPNNEKNYKLVCKLVLKDEQNIHTCAMSPDGQVLLVGRATTTKVFHLQPMDNKLKVTKLDNDFLFATGCKLAKFIDNSKIIICTVDDELMTLDLEAEDEDEKPEHVELEEPQNTKSSFKIPYMNNINQLEVLDSVAVVSRYCGIVTAIDLKSKVSKNLVHLMNFVTSISINETRGSIILTTAENKIYELSLQLLIEDSSTEKDGEESSVFTPWSKRNTENIPKQLKNMRQKCLGLFVDSVNEERMWMWGATWICRIDFSKDFPVITRKKSKKHGRDGLTITDESNYMNNELEDEEDDVEMELDEDLDILKGGKMKTITGNNNKLTQEAFYFNEKYRHILSFGIISDNELVVVERPPIMAEAQKAFQQPKFHF
ncbi:small subunit rRNA maturation protein UTP4 [Nakaseomyces bracarensis]|uniref:small subunit rRNA maturation protein UTP4 n=1 Tax=Nakaseomyces bracarensis TaxID=273131 RepID=UPI00387169DD